MRIYFSALTLSLAVTSFLFGQKKPLDHTVYDAWETAVERKLSDNGEFISFNVTPQEGDSRLMVMKTDGSWKMEIPRGYQLQFSPRSQFAVFKIKAPYADTRKARIAKKRPDDMPKDSLGVIVFANNSVNKYARVKSYKMPEDGGDWLLFQHEKPLPDTSAKKKTIPVTYTKAEVDSLRKIVDSLEAMMRRIPTRIAEKYELIKDDADEAEAAPVAGPDNGTILVWMRPSTGEKKEFNQVMDYAVDKNGNRFAARSGKKTGDSLSKASVWTYDVKSGKQQTIMTGLNDVKNIALDDGGTQIAFVAERDSSTKARQKFYKLWYFKAGQDSAKMLADRKINGLRNNYTISENASLRFSKSGERLLFGTAPIAPVKDTTVPEFEQANVDIWHYNDPDLQPAQLRRLDDLRKRSSPAVFYPASGKMVLMGDAYMHSIRPSGYGDGKYFFSQHDSSNRRQRQWAMMVPQEIVAIDAETGREITVADKWNGYVLDADASGEKLLLYKFSDRQFYVWNNGSMKKANTPSAIKWYDEDYDMPSDPSIHGVAGWDKNGDAFYVYDRYDIWKVDASGNKPAINITNGLGRKNKKVIRYVAYNPSVEEIDADDNLLFTVFDEANKQQGVLVQKLNNVWAANALGSPMYKARISNFQKAENAPVISYSVEDYKNSPDVRIARLDELSANPMASNSVISLNPQQNDYLWGTAELISWKAYDGKMTQGILYKPENFDPSKKYPLIAYFYEKLSDGLYGYSAPSPTPSRLNIPFFTSRGYLVLAPDISYRKGEPGQSAYDYIVSGVRHVVKMGIADSTKLGLQGQSWGGYQTVQLITMTPLFAAAWAGAPVANMTSAYGGIRWESGMNRQFQYEKSQSRIGYTLWERPDLYIKNSPLFHLPKVKTPLVIMHNDADGAVPWYQGIELFTAMRRLDKPVWLLNYNKEAHNLVERRNRKDIQVRQQQYFDWLLKGAAPAPWLQYGVSALDKGYNWGLE